MIVPLPKPEPERFHVRWVTGHRNLVSVVPGYAVFDRDRRITNTWPTRAAAEYHRNNIKALYARYGW